MKKVVIGLAMALGLWDAIFAMNYRITLKKNTDSDALKITCSNGGSSSGTEMQIGEEIIIGDFATAVWDGERFLIKAETDESIKIDAEKIPVELVAFFSPKCEVYTPFLSLSGESRVDDFLVRTGQSGGNLLHINGSLVTKNFSAFGSVVINGEVHLLDNGVLKLNGISANDVLTNNGLLKSIGKLKVDTRESLFAKTINNGEISSDSGNISIRTANFINSERGRIISEVAHFKTERQIQNDGKFKFDRLVLKSGRGIDFYSFLQRGKCIVKEEFFSVFNLESFGKTRIRHLIFPKVSELKACGETLFVDQVFGKMSLVQAQNGAEIEIGNVEDGADYVKSLGARLSINRLHSDRKINFSSELGGVIEIGRVEAPNNFMYSGDGVLKISGLEGEASAFINGTAQIELSGAANLSSLVSTDRSKAIIEDSNLDKAYLFGTEKSVFAESSVSSLHNKTEVNARNTRMDTVGNEGVMAFEGNTSTTKIYDSGKTIFKPGEHNVKEYVATNSKLKLSQEANRALTDSSAEINGALLPRDERRLALPNIRRNTAQLAGSDTSLSIDKLSGSGIIEAKYQNYDNMNPTGFHLKGNANISTYNQIPSPGQIPSHEGHLQITADMHRDIINTSNCDYKDVRLHLKMNKHKCENRDADFRAAGLVVEDASEFNNVNGFLGFSEYLDVETQEYSNVAKPTVQDNSRKIGFVVNGEEFSTVCPAKYYSPNENKGIAVGEGGIRIRSKGRISNIFATMATTGTFNASTNGIFDNTVGNIIALGREESSIKAQAINNACLSTCVREGKIDAYRSGGGWLNRWSWEVHMHVREEINQSPGSNMLFGGHLNLEGQVKNIGSKLSSNGLTHRGNLHSESQFDNKAEFNGSKAIVEGDDIKILNSRFITYENVREEQ